MENDLKIPIPAAKATVLLFNFTEQEIKAFRLLLREMPNIRLTPVEKASFGVTIRELITGKSAAAPLNGAAFSQRMILLAYAPDPMVHLLLAVCKKVTAEPVLRALLTETNSGWTAEKLYRELQAEERELQKYQR